MDWNDIRVSLAVARAGSLNQAAMALNMDQSTVSRRLTALEAQLGTTLFQRSRHGVLPTEAGTVFFASATEIERRATSLVDQVQAAGGQRAGVLRICGDQWTLNRLAANGLWGFMEQHPQIEMRLVSDIPHPTVWHQDPSIGLWFSSKPADGAFAVKLGAVPYAVYAAKGTLPCDWVKLRAQNAAGCRETYEADPSNDPNAEVRLSCTDAATVLESVAAGIGKAVLPRCLGDNDTRLTCLSGPEDDRHRTLCLHVHPDSLSSKRVEAMMAWLRTSFPLIFLPICPGN